METEDATRPPRTDKPKPLGQILSEMGSSDEGGSSSTPAAEGSVEGTLREGLKLLSALVQQQGRALTVTKTRDGRIGIFGRASVDEKAECIGEGDTLAGAIREVTRV